MSLSSFGQHIHCLVDSLDIATEVVPDMTTDTPSLSVGLFKLIRNDFVTQIPIVRRVYFNNFLQLNSVSSFRCHMVLNSDVSRYIYYI